VRLLVIYILWTVYKGVITTLSKTWAVTRSDRI